MKKLNFLILVGLFAIFLSACSEVPQAIDRPITPGDQVRILPFLPLMKKLPVFRTTIPSQKTAITLPAKLPLAPGSIFHPVFMTILSKIESKNFGRA
jgi:hypothetical protein